MSMILVFLLLLLLQRLHQVYIHVMDSASANSLINYEDLINSNDLVLKETHHVLLRAGLSIFSLRFCCFAHNTFAPSL